MTLALAKSLHEPTGLQKPLCPKITTIVAFSTALQLSRGRSTSRTQSGSSNRPRSNAPSGGKGKSYLTWSDRARGNQAQAPHSQDSHDPRLTNELEELRRASDSLRKENAQFKQEISRLATEIAEIRKLALKPPAPPAAASSSAMDTVEALPKAGAVKIEGRRGKTRLWNSFRSSRRPSATYSQASLKYKK
ncbi:hypothetical protein HPB52_004097 [Rhipicephalus sanguineus]|uniref:Uncharacterized protein n=1 Tax=Rhipicephalus sanguineus TaxID=34632 RepID=A0A9D4QHB8_RHISA|nr:hypothetical protein HPB52_004097 [Rhipicephalus sanguineus]